MRKDVDTFNDLKKVNAVLTNGHFEYNGGRHGSVYINHFAIFQNPKIARKLSLDLALRFCKHDINVVIGPRNGGASLAERVAEHLGFIRGRDIMPLGAEKQCEHCEGNGFYLTEDTMENIRDKQVLVVDDIGNSGRSVKNIIALTKSAGGIVVAVGYLCNRGSLKHEDFGNIEHYDALLDFPLESWDPAKGECRLCRDNIPLDTRYGHGKRKK